MDRIKSAISTATGWISVHPGYTLALWALSVAIVLAV